MDFSKYDTILHVAAIVHQKEQPEMEALYYACLLYTSIYSGRNSGDRHIPKLLEW